MMITLLVRKTIFSVLLAITIGVGLLPAPSVRAENAVLSIIPVGRRPISVAIEPSLHLAAVANRKDQTVTIVDLNARTVLSTIPVGKKPSGVAISVNGANKVAVSNEGDGTLTLIDLVTNGIRTIPIGPSPRDVALAPRLGLALVPYEKKGNAILAVVGLKDLKRSKEVALGKGDPVAVAVDEGLGLAVEAVGKPPKVLNGVRKCSFF